MKLKPGGFWHTAFMMLGGMGGVAIWTIIGTFLSNLIEELNGKSLDSYGLLFFVPYFISMFVFALGGVWVGNVLAVKSKEPANVNLYSDIYREKELLIYTSKSELLGYCVFTTSFFICPLTISLIGKADSIFQAFLWVVSPLIGILLFHSIAPHKLLSSNPQIVIDNKGITNSRGKKKFILWHEIDRIDIKHSRGGPVLRIHLKDPNTSGMNLNLIGLDRSTEEVWKFITHLDAAKEPLSKGIGYW